MNDALADHYSSALAAMYVQLPLAFFRSAAAPRLNTYWLPEGQETPVLLASSNLGLTHTDLSEIQDHGHRSLFVKRSDFEYMSSVLLESLEELVSEESTPGEERFAVLQTVIGIEVEKAFRAVKCCRFVGIAHRVGAQIAELVSTVQIDPHLLFDLAHHDTRTFVHVTNVAAYAVLLAQALGIDDPQELQQIAVGALLHDVGKRNLPQELLNKQGKLTEWERDQIRLHPLRGYEELCERDDLSFGQLMMIYQHHEWVDGSGYPVAIPAEEIHPWAKMLAVVDVFDALTVQRPYRDPLPANEALNILSDGVNKQFDGEAVNCWITLFHLPFQKLSGIL